METDLITAYRPCYTIWGKRGKKSDRHYYGPAFKTLKAAFRNMQENFAKGKGNTGSVVTVQTTPEQIKAINSFYHLNELAEDWN